MHSVFECDVLLKVWLFGESDNIYYVKLKEIDSLLRSE